MRQGQPYFSGNYGSALGSTANAANLIAQAGATQGQMYANLGQQVGGMIKQYGLNKEKRNKLQSTLEGQLSADPSIVQQLTMTGDEQYDKKNIKLFDKVQSGDASIADLERANGLLSGKTTQENAMLKKQNAETQQKMNELNLEMAQLLKDPKVSDAIDQYKLNKITRDSKKQIIPSETDAKQATNKLTTETAQASMELLPLQTSDKKEELEARSNQRKIVNEVIDQSGGIQGMASKEIEATDLKIEGAKQEIKKKKALADYYENVGLAKKLEAVGKLNPSLKQQLDPLTKMQSDLLSTKVAVPGEGQTRIPLSDYLELNKEDDTKYPLNGMPGLLHGNLQNIDKQMEGALSEQLVPVYVPDETTSQPLQQTPSSLPAYKQALNRRGEETQQEYMNTPGVGGAGFPFMP
jgi:hypothetical protein